MVEAAIRILEQTLPKGVVYNRTMEGINAFRTLFEPISPANFWNLGGDFQFVSKPPDEGFVNKWIVTGSVHLKIDGQRGKTELRIQVHSYVHNNVSLDLDEPLVEGQEEQNQSHYSHVLLGDPYDGDPSTDSERAWNEIIRLRTELEDQVLAKRIKRIIRTTPAS